MRIMNEKIRARVGETFKIKLPGNPTTGFLWIAKVLSPDKIISPLDTTWENEVTLAGQPRTQVLNFKALSAGKADLIIEYKRPWETDNVLEKRTFTIHVDPT